MKKIIYIFILIGFGFTMSGQSLKAFINAGEEAVREGDHYNAMFFYDNALEFDTSRLDIRYKLAESSRLFNAYTVAEKQYQFVLDNDSDNSYPLASFYLGNVQQLIGKYDDARRNFSLYLSENSGEETRQILKAEKEVEAIDWAISQEDNPQPGYTVSRIENEINTPYSEFGAIKKDDILYYSSLRFEKELKDSKVNKLYSKVLSQDNGSVNEFDIINDYTQHVAHTSYNHDGTRLYYTICDYIDELEISCDIYYREITKEGEYSEGIKLQDSINIEGTTSTQPSIGFNLLTNEEFLFFTSDREGGKGGLDIWYSKISANGFDPPINIQNINTVEDEITPFYHSDSGTLYFSSKGYLGMGGFDVYSSYNSSEGFTDPINLKSPVNGSFNDLYYSLNEAGNEGYLSSNRTGSLFLEESYEACCYDIYKVDIEDIMLDLNALTFNEETKDSLPGVNVRIIDVVTGELIDEYFNPESADHKFSIKHGRNYLIISEKSGFETDTSHLSTRNLTNLGEIIKKIYMKPQHVKLDVFTYDKISKLGLNGVTVVLEEIDGDAPYKISDINTGGNDFIFDIIAGHRYSLSGSKPGYKTEQLIFDAVDIIDGVITKELFLFNSGDYLNSLLPISVYFNNDHPDERSRNLYTNLTYTETYLSYKNQEQEFISNYSTTPDYSDKLKSEAEVKQFFEKDVTDGFMNLQNFMSVLNSRLEAGDVIELSLKGFASPRAANKYNLAIGQRRIWTLKNELTRYENGVLQQYINSGSLQVSEVSFGEEIAPKHISDSFSNRRLSVYSVEASKERKAEIVKVRILNN